MQKPNQSNDHWELGSEFSWPGSFEISRISMPWTGQYKLYATGRGALLGLAQLLGTSRRSRIHLPSYFCENVAESLKQSCEVHSFTDSPDEDAPHFETIKASAGDVIVAVNFFGVRDGKCWNHYQESHKDAIVVEDHTHDPLSSWAYNSRAKYALASLRKTIPLPDGAVLWSPSGLECPPPPASTPIGSYLKLEGMLLKDAYLRGLPLEKDRFRDLQVQGEKSLEKGGLGEACAITQLLLPLLPIHEFRKKREENIRSVLNAISMMKIPLNPLFTCWPAGGVPLGAVYRCNSEAIREKLVAHLIKNNVYASIHWPLTGSRNAHKISELLLSRHVFTLPLDHRYEAGDVERAIRTISRFWDKAIN